MTNHDLFRSLNYVDPDYLEHSEGQTVSGRLPLRVILTAAVIALLTCSVLAGILITNHIAQAEPVQTNRPAIVHSLSGSVQVSEGFAEINLALDMSEARPVQIEHFYVPMYFSENWQMKEQIRPSHQENREIYPDTRLMWQDGENNWAEFTQHVVDARIAADCPAYPFDGISTGYNDTCLVENVQLGQYDLFCVTVPPSSTQSEGQTLYHEGLRKFYWSDGLYLFTLAVSYDVSDETVRLALDSLTEVPDITDYEQVTYLEEPERVTYPAQENMLVPAQLPDDWTQYYGYLAPTGCYELAWTPGAESQIAGILELTQVPTDSQTGLIRDWETTTEEHVEKQVYTVQDWQVTVYSRSNKVQAFWHAGQTDYVLSVRGIGTQVEAVLDFIAGLEMTDTPEAWLME